MTTLRTKIIRSHQEARRFMRSKLSQGMIVHHIDHNPLNNRCDNLWVMSKSKHHSMHPRFTQWKPKGRKSIITMNNELEEQLILYNFNL